MIELNIIFFFFLVKDKAGVLLELENLQTVRNELTEEVTKLHALLEQERSKVASLQSELQQHNKHKDKVYNHLLNLQILFFLYFYFLSLHVSIDFIYCCRKIKKACQIITKIKYQGILMTYYFF